MGLEVVEFIIDVEQALGLSIPERDTSAIATPREFVDYICARLPEIDPHFGTSAGRWTRAEVEQLVDGLLAKAGAKSDVTLDTPFRDIFP